MMQSEEEREKVKKKTEQSLREKYNTITCINIHKMKTKIHIMETKQGEAKKKYSKK